MKRGFALIGNAPLFLETCCGPVFQRTKFVLQIATNHTQSSPAATAAIAINGYQSNNHSGQINYITVPAGSNPQITLMDIKVNFINLGAVQLATIVNQGSFIFTSTPTAARPVVFNITTSSAVTFAASNMGGVGPQDAAYMLWNFPIAASVNASGSNATYGSVPAPDATFHERTTARRCAARFLPHRPWRITAFAPLIVVAASHSSTLPPSV